MSWFWGESEPAAEEVVAASAAETSSWWGWGETPSAASAPEATSSSWWGTSDIAGASSETGGTGDAVADDSGGSWWWGGGGLNSANDDADDGARASRQRLSASLARTNRELVNLRGEYTIVVQSLEMKSAALTQIQADQQRTTVQLEEEKLLRRSHEQEVESLRRKVNECEAKSAGLLSSVEALRHAQTEEDRSVSLVLEEKLIELEVMKQKQSRCITLEMKLDDEIKKAESTAKEFAALKYAQEDMTHELRDLRTRVRDSREQAAELTAQLMKKDDEIEELAKLVEDLTSRIEQTQKSI